MELSFTKMHGAGNDFVVIDNRETDLFRRMNVPELAVLLCNRRLGVGADQLLLLCSSNTADFKMMIFNSDGSQVEMCGNGIRCLAKYIWDRGISTRDVLKIETAAGTIRPERNGDLVRVDMGYPVLEAEQIPVDLKSADPVIDYPLKISDREFKITCVSMGNPHAVIFIDEEVDCFPVNVYGPAIENHPFFPNKANVEFVNVLNKKELKMRVWERGTGETLACGTGASAAAVAGMMKDLIERNVTVHLRGGDLNVKWPRNDHVYMTGPAVEVFEGRITNLSEKKAEQRRHQRKTCQIPIEFFRKTESRNKLYQCVVLDISEAGAGMISDVELKPGEVLSLFKKDSQTVLKSAIVIWNTKYKDKNKAGLMFV